MGLRNLFKNKSKEKKKQLEDLFFKKISEGQKQRSSEIKKVMNHLFNIKKFPRTKKGYEVIGDFVEFSSDLSLLIYPNYCDAILFYKGDEIYHGGDFKYLQTLYEKGIDAIFYFHATKYGYEGIPVKKK